MISGPPIDLNLESPAMEHAHRAAPVAMMRAAPFSLLRALVASLACGEVIPSRRLLVLWGWIPLDLTRSNIPGAKKTRSKAAHPEQPLFRAHAQAHGAVPGSGLNS